VDKKEEEKRGMEEELRKAIAMRND